MSKSKIMSYEANKTILYFRVPKSLRGDKTDSPFSKTNSRFKSIKTYKK